MLPIFLKAQANLTLDLEISHGPFHYAALEQAVVSLDILLFELGPLAVLLIVD